MEKEHKEATFTKPRKQFSESFKRMVAKEFEKGYSSNTSYNLNMA
jgi:hypothetical protein